VAEYTKAEDAFIDQMTRKKLVAMADSLIQDGESRGLPEPYRTHALERGWLSKRDPNKLTGKGYGIAASFLKR